MFDQGLEVYSEVDNGKGRTDLQGYIYPVGSMMSFVYKGLGFIIETKYNRLHNKVNVEESLKQLSLYKEQNDIKDVCLVIFTDIDTEHVLYDDSVIWIYVGDEAPRKRSESK